MGQGHTILVIHMPPHLHSLPPSLPYLYPLPALCTPWPERLPLLPIRVTTRNYVFPSSNIRHSGARIVKLTVRRIGRSTTCEILLSSLSQLSLSDLTLTDCARHKMIQLAGPRYDAVTDQLTLVGKKCPTRKQNREYIMYLLKVLYLESNVSWLLAC